MILVGCCPVSKVLKAVPERWLFMEESPTYRCVKGVCVGLEEQSEVLRPSVATGPHERL